MLSNINRIFIIIVMELQCLFNEALTGNFVLAVRDKDFYRRKAKMTFKSPGSIFVYSSIWQLAGRIRPWIIQRIGIIVMGNQGCGGKYK
jgi:hypothetical protein